MSVGMLRPDDDTADDPLRFGLDELDTDVRGKKPADETGAARRLQVGGWTQS
jgi:hypothetical protein